MQHFTLSISLPVLTSHNCMQHLTIICESVMNALNSLSKKVLFKSASFLRAYILLKVLFPAWKTCWTSAMSNLQSTYRWDSEPTYSVKFWPASRWNLMIYYSELRHSYVIFSWKCLDFNQVVSLIVITILILPMFKKLKYGQPNYNSGEI